MGKVHRDVVVPIPAGAAVYRNGRVFDPLHGDKEIMLIGYAVSDTEMNPNQNYFQYHRAEWLTIHPEGQERVRPDVLEAGLYGALLGAAQKSGLLDALNEAFRFPAANAILDYGMAALRGEQTADSVTFHGAPCPQQWYEDFFRAPDTAARGQAILERWLRTCTERGLTQVYLGTGSPPQPGAVWAVCADGAAAGLPAMCFPQGAGVWTAIQWLAARNIGVRGILWDTGCRRRNAPGIGMPWAEILQPESEAFAHLLRWYGASLREDLRCYLGEDLFGTEGVWQIQNGPAQRAVLLYRPLQWAKSASLLLQTVGREKRALEDAMAAGEKPQVPEPMKPYLSIGSDGQTVQVYGDALQAAYRRQGYLGLLVSPEMDARRAADILQARDSAVLAFGSGSDQEGQLLVDWIVGILQMAVRKACLAHGMDWPAALQTLSQVQYRYCGRSYRCSEDIPQPALDILGELDITLEMLQDFAPEVSRRYLQTGNPPSRVYRNRLPWKLSSQGDAGSEAAAAAAPPDKPDQTESVQADAQKSGEKGKGGRPKGKKDSYQRVRSTREQMEARRGTQGAGGKQTKKR